MAEVLLVGSQWYPFIPFLFLVTAWIAPKFGTSLFFTPGALVVYHLFWDQFPQDGIPQEGFISLLVCLLFKALVVATSNKVLLLDCPLVALQTPIHARFTKHYTHDTLQQTDAKPQSL